MVAASEDGERKGRSTAVGEGPVGVGLVQDCPMGHLLKTAEFRPRVALLLGLPATPAPPVNVQFGFYQPNKAFTQVIQATVTLS